MAAPKRPRIEVDSSSDDEALGKRAKKRPKIFSSEEATLRPKAFILGKNDHTFNMLQDCALEDIKQLNSALLDASNQLKTFNMTPMSDVNQMSFELVGSILDSFIKNETLTSLTFNRVSLDLKSLVPILKKKHLQSLTISKMTAIRSSIADVANIIGCKSLTHLDLSYNSSSQLTRFDQLIANHKQLRSLILSENAISDIDASLIAGVLAQNSCLTRLELKNTGLTNENAITLAKALENNQALTSLDLSGNSLLYEPAFIAIIKLLDINKRITTINLDGLSFDTHEADLFNALGSTSVKSLTVLLETKLGTDCFSAALKNWPALSELKITCNDVKLLMDFASKIPRNTSLKQISVFATRPRYEPDVGLITTAFQSRRLKYIESSTPKLSMYFEQIASTKQKMEAFIDSENWEGLWSFVKEKIEEGTAFEELINADHYASDVYMRVLEAYLQRSEAHEAMQQGVEHVTKTTIEQTEILVGVLQQNIEDAQRKIEATKKELTSVTQKLENLNSDLKKILTQKQFESQTRIKAQEAVKKARENNAFLEQCKRPVMSWTLDEVLTLLQRLQLGAYTKTFAENLITGEALVSLTTPDFYQLDLPLMKTKILMSALYKLKHVKSLTEIPENSPMRWTNEQVIAWLEENQLGYLAEQFRVHGITGNELVVMDINDLVHGLQIKSIPYKTKLLAAIQKLQVFEIDKLNNDAAKKKVPKQFLCPITHDIMKDPVSTLDGHTYERTAIEDWLKNHDTSPLTNEKLSSKILIPNHQLKSLIAEFAKD